MIRETQGMSSGSPVKVSEVSAQTPWSAATPTYDAATTASHEARTRATADESASTTPATYAASKITQRCSGELGKNCGSDTTTNTPKAIMLALARRRRGSWRRAVPRIATVTAVSTMNNMPEALANVDTGLGTRLAQGPGANLARCAAIARLDKR